MKKLLAGLLVFVAVFAAVFHAPLWRAYAASAFGPEELRGYERLFRGNGGARASGESLFRTGKVVVVRTSVQSVVQLATGYACSWNEIDPGRRALISREIDPPRLDDSWFELDSELRASSPEEVRTVILCAPQKVFDGVYVEKENPTQRVGNAGRLGFLIHLYDLPSRSFIGSTTVQGSHARAEIRIGEKMEGEKPDLARFIARLRTGSL